MREHRWAGAIHLIIFAFGIKLLSFSKVHSLLLPTTSPSLLPGFLSAGTVFLPHLEVKQNTTKKDKTQDAKKLRSALTVEQPLA